VKTTEIAGVTANYPAVTNIWNPLLSNDIFPIDFSEVGRLSGTLTHWPDLHQMIIKFETSARCHQQSVSCVLSYVCSNKDDILLAKKSVSTAITLDQKTGSAAPLLQCSSYLLDRSALNCSVPLICGIFNVLGHQGNKVK
jgi:hypothetical protein